MIEQTFSARRCRDTRKPRAGECPDVVFYRCSVCGALFPVTGGQTLEDKEIICCGQKAERLVPVTPESVRDSLKVSYQITGGYNDNAVKVSWRASGQAPEWIYLKTFTGGYLKYVAETKRSPMVFALADTDAFAYCDEDPCLECVFRCKRGFIIYVYGKETGLIELPLDKMNAQWQTGAKNP
ncbi:MAG: hypothetical protein Q4C66_07235 [Lachnospiraceae bacterium]|nr:hypothetical protein [Lachnospiraceae bacterium]